MGLCYVKAYLGAESLGVREALLGAKAFEEGEAEGSGFSKVNRVEVEEMGFNGEGICAEGGTIANVGDRLEGLFSDSQGRDVDAVGGEEFRVGGEVDGGDGEAGAVAPAGGGGGVDAERAAKERAGVRYVPSSKEGADAGGGDDGPAEEVRGKDADSEAEFGAELLEGGDGAFGAIAETEVLAFVNFGGVGGVSEDGFGEEAGGELGESGVEGKDEGGVNAGGGEQFEFTGKRGDEGVRGFGAEMADGMGVEGDGQGFLVGGTGLGDDFGQDLLMAAVDAIKVADGGDRGPELGGCEFREGVEG